MIKHVCSRCKREFMDKDYENLEIVAPSNENRFCQKCRKYFLEVFLSLIIKFVKIGKIKSQMVRIHAFHKPISNSGINDIFSPPVF